MYTRVNFTASKKIREYTHSSVIEYYYYYYYTTFENHRETERGRVGWSSSRLLIEVVIIINA